MFKGWEKYAVFSGRAGRREYWLFLLLNVLVCLAGTIVDAVLYPRLHLAETAATLAFLIPNMAVTFRRLHDIDRSGWWFLLILVPVIGWIVLLVWHLKPSTPGPNRFGPHPSVDNALG